MRAHVRARLRSACRTRPAGAAPGAARWRTASAETGARAHVGQRDAVEQRGRRERPRVEQHVDALDARQAPPGVARGDGHELHPEPPPAAEGISSSSPPAAAALERGGSASGSSPPRSAASSASTAASGGSAPRDRLRVEERARSPQHEPLAERVARVEHEAVLARAVRRPLDLGDDRVAALGRDRPDHARAERRCPRSTRGGAPRRPPAGRRRPAAPRARRCPSRTASGRPRRRRRSPRCAGAAHRRRRGRRRGSSRRCPRAARRSGGARRRRRRAPT